MTLNLSVAACHSRSRFKFKSSLNVGSPTIKIKKHWKVGGNVGKLTERLVFLF